MQNYFRFALMPSRLTTCKLSYHRSENFRCLLQKVNTLQNQNQILIQRAQINFYIMESESSRVTVVYAAKQNFHGWYANDHSRENVRECLSPSHHVLYETYRITYSIRLHGKIFTIERIIAGFPTQKFYRIRYMILFVMVCGLV